jgi:hypothetical protein
MKCLPLPTQHNTIGEKIAIYIPASSGNRNYNLNVGFEVFTVVVMELPSSEI